MISLREKLQNIGVSHGMSFSWRDCWLPPRSLSVLIRSLDAPSSWSETIPGDEWDEDWTEEVQGCAWGHERWFFTSYNPPRLYVFDGKLNKVHFWNLESPPPAPRPGSDPHLGHIILNGDSIFIDHFFQNDNEGDAGGQILVLNGDGTTINYSHWIKLENVDGQRVVLLAINFDEQLIITSTGDLNISKVFLHNMDGTFTGRRMRLNPPISDGGYAQGGFWSPNNHLYISSGKRGITPRQYIYCYSPLNGFCLGAIAVTAEASRQELEGICYAAVTRNGQFVQVHAVLLENEDVFPKDDIFLKSFSADKPELI